MKSVKHAWGGKASITALAVAMMLAACGGGGGTEADANAPGQTDQGGAVKVAGTVSGLTAEGLVLSNGTDSVAVSANASGFALPAGGTLSIAHQPLGFTQACEVGGTADSPTVSCGQAIAKVSWAAGWGGLPRSKLAPLAGPDGRLYFAANDFVYSVLPSGEGGYRIVAGSVYESGVADGAGDVARFRGPQSAVIDAAGNWYALESDASGYAIRKVTPAGVVSTLASGFGGVSPQLSNLALGPNNQLYLISYQQDSTYSVQRFDAQGQLEVLFNTGTMASPNSPSLSALVVGADGAIYFADTSNYAIYKVAPGASTAVLLAGSGTSESCYLYDPQTDQSSTVCVDGAASSARFGNIVSLAIDSQGTLYALDVDGTLVRRISASGDVQTIVGDPAAPVSGNADGTGAAATLDNANGLSLSADGATLYIGQGGTTAVRVVSKLSAAGADVSTILPYTDALDKQPSTAKQAFLLSMSAVASDALGNLLVTDAAPSSGMMAAAPSALIRKVSAQGVVSTVGSAQVPSSYVRSLKVGPDGLPYVAGLCSIERMALSGTVSTLTGNPASTRCRSSVDGAPGTAAVFNIIDIAPDAAGNVYFSEPGRVLRKLDSTGSITTLTLVDGDANGASFPPTTWQALAMGAQGQLYASNGTQVFKVVVQGAQGTVTLVAGKPGTLGATDGDALTQASFSSVYALSLDAAGNLYASDSYFNGGLVRQITPAGQVRTLAGGSSNNNSSSRDGVGAGSRFGSITTGGLTVTPGGEVYVLDSRYLRKVEAIKDNRQ